MSAMTKRGPRARRGWRVGLVMAALVAAGASQAVATHAAPRPHSSATLTLVAYSTPAEAYARLIPAFQKTPQGQGVSFQTSYGASGEQSRAVLAGLPADIVAFSLEPDITRLVNAGLVDTRWNANVYKGMVTDSVVVLVVRPGNPKHISGWADLIKPGVDVITPNPFTSGGARWNIMAGYGAQLRLGKSATQAVGYLKALFANVSVQDSSGRAAMQTFAGGKGDVLIAYENEAITALHKGIKLQYVIPSDTILIENPIAVLSHSPRLGQAQAFVNFLWTPAAQTIWGQQGYRPVLPAVARAFTKQFPTPHDLFTIKYLGGWSKVTKTFFDPQNGIVAQIERSKGVSLGAH